MTLKKTISYIVLTTVTVLSVGTFFKTQAVATAETTPAQAKVEEVPLTLTVAVERLKDLSDRERQAFLGNDDSEAILAVYNGDDEGSYGFASGPGAVIMDEETGEIISEIDPANDPDGTTIGAIKEALKKYDATKIKK
ncbi:hypothetical protein [Vagococcus salmoninarum]|uniref:hypothetical protein n=1 Tax=Vagococcus salmoninarum TaxID=2739 RepID=UPI00187E53AC|nr:hypothetical protein [Vagococcus salmoninarum]MBE9389862.1 hypothetical protein [Vagococcus salmoninarum]